MTAVIVTRCGRCRAEVPAGKFCGVCGGALEAQADASPIELRRSAFAAGPRESVLRPYLASSLFPQLPERSRAPFRLTLVIGAILLLVSAVLRLPALGIATGVLALPLLFMLYLRASGADRDVPRSVLVLAGVLGALLGAAWVLLCGQVVSRNYGVPMAVGLAMHHLLREGLIIPAVGIALMVVPPIMIRMIRPSSRESLDGFMIGALSALAFTGAATLTRLAPQVATGLIAHARPVKGLAVEAVLCGVTIPISAAAAGGMLGIALWFRPGGQHAARVRLVLALLAALALIVHGAVGVIDIVGMPQLTMVIFHVSITVVALLGLRLVLQLALLHEEHDRIAQDRPLLCPYCDHVVPDMAFCPACGVATRASSQQSRRDRRGDPRPRALIGSQDGEQVFPGYALPSATYTAPAPVRTRAGWLLSRWGAGVMTVALALGAAALVLTPKIAHYMCPPECGRPPSGTPVMALPRFQPPDGSFSVSHPAPSPVYTVSTGNSGVTATYTGGDGGVMQFFSEPARGRSARDVTTAIIKRTYPDAKVAYEIPNAMVGYRPGFGAVADDWPQGATASYSRLRILVMTAVKDDLALVAFATGPYHAFGPDFGPGPPSGANLEIAQDMGKYVNSFAWRGDPPR